MKIRFFVKLLSILLMSLPAHAMGRSRPTLPQAEGVIRNETDLPNSALSLHVHYSAYYNFGGDVCVSDDETVPVSATGAFAIVEKSKADACSGSLKVDEMWYFEVEDGSQTLLSSDWIYNEAEFTKELQSITLKKK